MGLKGRFGADWRWDANYSWGKTDSATHQTNVNTVIRSAFAMDAVIDDQGGLGDLRHANLQGYTSMVRQSWISTAAHCPVPRALRQSRRAASRSISSVRTFSNSAYVFDRDGNRFLNGATPITYDAAKLQQEALELFLRVG